MIVFDIPLNPRSRSTMILDGSFDEAGACPRGNVVPTVDRLHVGITVVPDCTVMAGLRVAI